MLPSFRLVSHSRCSLSTGVSMFMRGSLRKTSHNEINKEATVYQAHNWNLQMKMFHFFQLNSSRTSKTLGSQNYSTSAPWCTKSKCIDSSTMLVKLQEAQTLFNNQEWESAYIEYIGLVEYVSSSHEVHGNLVVSELQYGDFSVAVASAVYAAHLCPGRMVYYELLVQALIKMKDYSEALDWCNEGLGIDSKILEGSDSDIEQIKMLKQHCVEKMKGGLNGGDSEADDFPFRQFLQGFISQDALEKIATTVFPLHLKGYLCTPCIEMRVGNEQSGK